MSASYSVKDVVLDKDILDPSKIVSGNPEVFSKILSTSMNESVIRGIWKCTAGVVTDIEEDEMFTIVEGRATVYIEGGPTLEISPGYVGFFSKGAKTKWVIHEDILKTFQISLTL